MERLTSFFTELFSIISDFVTFPTSARNSPIWTYRFHVLFYDILYFAVLYVLFLAPFSWSGVGYATTIIFLLFIVLIYHRAWFVRNHSGVFIENEKPFRLYWDAFYEEKYRQALGDADHATYEHEDGRLIKITKSQPSRNHAMERYKSRYLKSQAPESVEEMSVVLEDDEMYFATYELSEDGYYPKVLYGLYGCFVCVVLFILFQGYYNAQTQQLIWFFQKHYFLGVFCVVAAIAAPVLKKEYVFGDKRFGSLLHLSRRFKNINGLNRLRLELRHVRVLVAVLFCIPVGVLIECLITGSGVQLTSIFIFLLLPYLFLSTHKERKKEESGVKKKKKAPPKAGQKNPPVADSATGEFDVIDDVVELDPDDSSIEVEGGPALTQESEAVLYDEEFYPTQQVDGEDHGLPQLAPIDESPTDPLLQAISEDVDDPTDPNVRLMSRGGSVSGDYVYGTYEARADNGGLHTAKTVEARVSRRANASVKGKVVVGDASIDGEARTLPREHAIPQSAVTGSQKSIDFQDEMLQAVAPEEDLSAPAGKRPVVARGNKRSGPDPAVDQSTYILPSPKRASHKAGEHTLSPDAAQAATGQMKSGTYGSASDTVEAYVDRSPSADELEQLAAEAQAEKDKVEKTFDGKYGAPGTLHDADAYKASAALSDLIIEDPIIDTPVQSGIDPEQLQRIVDDLESQKKSNKYLIWTIVFLLMVFIASGLFFRHQYIQLQSRFNSGATHVHNENKQDAGVPPFTMQDPQDSADAGQVAVDREPAPVIPQRRTIVAPTRLRPRPRPKPRKREFITDLP